MKVSELYMAYSEWNATNDIAVYVENEFKGWMKAYKMNLVYGDYTVEIFNETHIILSKEEESND